MITPMRLFPLAAALALALVAASAGRAHDPDTPRVEVLQPVPAPGVRAALSSGSHEIPLTGGRRHLIVEATLNSAVSGPMLVDTGSSYCVLTRTTALRLGLHARPTRSIPVATANGQVAASLVELDSMQLRGARLARVDALIMDAVEPPLIGIIGLSFLNNFRYSVDAAEGTLRLER